MKEQGPVQIPGDVLEGVEGRRGEAGESSKRAQAMVLSAHFFVKKA